MVSEFPTASAFGHTLVAAARGGSLARLEENNHPEGAGGNAGASRLQ